MAPKLHTHYDNLKVSPNAPVEVIRAAYKAMAQKYHPDRNAEDGAQQVMQGLNESWDVLSDPVQRAAHDAWIADQEGARLAVEAREAEAAASGASGPAPLPARRRRRRKTGLARRWAPLASLSIFVGVSTFCVAVFSELSESALPAAPSTRAGTLPRSTTPVPAPAPAHVAVAAPVASGEVLQQQRRQNALLEYGQALPDASGAIIGARQTPGSGPVGLTIDNPHSTTPVVAKLCHAVWSHCWALQHVYIEAGRTLTLNKLSPGKYDVRHVNLDSGLIYRSGMLEVPEAGKEHVARQAGLTLTLREPADGRSGATRIDLHQF